MKTTINGNIFWFGLKNTVPLISYSVVKFNFMGTVISMEDFTSSTISDIGRKNYKTYVKHYKTRNLKPMPLEEFLKNYSN